MPLRLKNKVNNLIEIDDLSVRLQESDQKKDFFRSAVQALLQFIKDFSLDIKEIKSTEFKNDIKKSDPTEGCGEIDRHPCL